MLTREGCECRLARFRALLEAHQLDGATIGDRRDLWWLCGLPLPGPFEMPAMALVTADDLTLLAPNGSEPLLADSLLSYEWHSGGTQNLDKGRTLAALAGQTLAGRAVPRLGFQAESTPHWLVVELAGALAPESWSSVDDELADLQRTKEPDELAALRASVAATQAAYAAVAAVIAPGVNELAVLAAGQAAASAAAGEPVFHSGDYRCAAPGGSARDRTCGAGELFIVDAWSLVGGYWSDLCRTFAVGRPSALQAEVHAHLADILREVPAQLRPGVEGTSVAAWMDQRIREHPHLASVGLQHHAGHGVGLRAHTVPDLNLAREGTLRAGDVVSCEPGAYTSDLSAGIRLENSFLITEQGCEPLSDYPVEW